MTNDSLTGGLARMPYSYTNMAGVGVKGLTIDSVI